MDSSDEEVNSVVISRYQPRRNSVSTLPTTSASAASIQSRASLKPAPTTPSAPRLEANERILRRARTPAPMPVNNKIIPKTVAFGLTTKVADTVKGRGSTQFLNRTTSATNIHHYSPSDSKTLSSQLQSQGKFINEQQKQIAEQDKIIKELLNGHEKLWTEINGLKDEVKEVKNTNNSLKIDMYNLTGTISNLRTQYSELMKGMQRPPSQPSSYIQLPGYKDEIPVIDLKGSARESYRRETSFVAIERQIRADEKENSDFTKGYTPSMIRYANMTLNRTVDDDARSSTSSHRQHRNYRYRDGISSQVTEEDEENLDDLVIEPVSTQYHRRRTIQNAMHLNDDEFPSTTAQRYQKEVETHYVQRRLHHRAYKK